MLKFIQEVSSIIHNFIRIVSFSNGHKYYIIYLYHHVTARLEVIISWLCWHNVDYH